MSGPPTDGTTTPLPCICEADEHGPLTGYHSVACLEAQVRALLRERDEAQRLLKIAREEISWRSHVTLTEQARAEHAERQRDEALRRDRGSRLPSPADLTATANGRLHRAQTAEAERDELRARLQANSKEVHTLGTKADLGGGRAASSTAALRPRVQEITAEYWETREEQSERVAVARLVLALARAEVSGGTTPSEPPTAATCDACDAPMTHYDADGQWCAKHSGGTATGSARPQTQPRLNAAGEHLSDYEHRLMTRSVAFSMREDTARLAAQLDRLVARAEAAERELELSRREVAAKHAVVERMQADKEHWTAAAARNCRRNYDLAAKAEARVALLEEALRAIAENAEAWHGVEQARQPDE